MGLSENLKSTSWSHYSTQPVASIAILANKLSKPNLFIALKMSFFTDLAHQHVGISHDKSCYFLDCNNKVTT
jgi:hypothetical protein